MVTTHLKPGYLRKNGVPYSKDAVLTEYFNVHADPYGADWLIVTTTVHDPAYLVVEEYELQERVRRREVEATAVHRAVEGRWQPSQREELAATLPLAITDSPNGNWPGHPTQRKIYFVSCGRWDAPLGPFFVDRCGGSESFRGFGRA
ncbi:MAG: hypothetical protein ACXVZZ_14125 [Terriglobales bacterium]